MSSPRAAAVAVAERFVAACILRDPENADEYLALVGPDHILDHGFRCIIEAATEVRRHGQLPTLEAVHVAITRAGRAVDFDANGGLAVFLADVFSSTPTVVGFEPMAAEVREAATFRRYATLAAAFAAESADPLDAAPEIGAKYATLIDEASDAATIDEPGTIADAFDVGLAECRRRSTRREGARTGLDSLSTLVPTIDPGQLFVVAGRPGDGKTALMLGIALHNSAMLGLPTLMFSLEMSRSEIGMRAAVLVTGQSGFRFRNGEATQQEIEQLEREASKDLGYAKLRIDDRPSLKVEQIAAVCRRQKRRRGLGLVCVDYLQLIPATNPRESRREQIEHTSRMLKRIARELSVPVIAGCQLNREVENRPDRQPKLSDLREAGGIEADADAVLLLWRKPDQGEHDPLHAVTAIIAKQRNGPTGKAELKYRRSSMRFEDRFPEM